MSDVIRAEIIDKNRARPYSVGDIEAMSLPGLCAALLKAGYPPDAEVQCFHPGRSHWDIRAKSIGAAASEACRNDESAGEGVDIPRRETRTRTPSAGLSLPCQTAARVFNVEALIWHGVRSSNRDLAVIKRDLKYPDLFRVYLTPNRVTDLLNLARAQEAAVDLALATLNREVIHKRSRKQRRQQQHSAERLT
jgi:hypothetical protein